MSEDEPLGRLPPVKRRLVETSELIEIDTPTSFVFQHSVLCQCCIPYRNPDPLEIWDRRQGSVALRIKAGVLWNEQKQSFVQVGLPWGVKPRILLAYLSTEALRTGSPTVDVGRSLTDFVKKLGLVSKGRNVDLVKDQLKRLACADVQFVIRKEDNARQTNTRIVTGIELWLPLQDNGQRSTWINSVTLSSEYFSSLQNHAVPLDPRALAALSHSAMALDVYSWLTQRLYRISPKHPVLVSWDLLHGQFGPGYDKLFKFRQVFRVTLREVLSQYPRAKLEDRPEGLLLFQSPPPVKPRAIGI